LLSVRMYASCPFPACCWTLWTTSMTVVIIPAITLHELHTCCSPLFCVACLARLSYAL
jgi:hypothetical protein